MILIDDASEAVPKMTLDHPRFRHKLQTFLLSVSSVAKLEKILKHLKTTKWWNHMASFLIIDSPAPFDQGCSEAFNILSTAWEMNLLHAKFICYHESKGPLIYSYNPYTDQATIRWQVEKTYKINDTHPWTLLFRKYQDSQEICKDLDFDQTKDLGGYEVQSSFYRSNISYSSSVNGESINHSIDLIARYMFRALNATPKMFANQSLQEHFNMTSSGFTSIFLNPWYQQNNFNSSMTYPLAHSGLATITQRRGYLSQIGKLLRVIDHASRYAVVIVCFVTFVFFRFFLRQSVTSAFLSIVRLTCNSAVPNVPNNVAARIYLSGLFLFLVTMQAIYQGQLASLLTKPVVLPDVETFKDLENFKYTVYSSSFFISYFKKLAFRERVVELESFDCVKYVLEDDAAACLHDRIFHIDSAYKFHLHLSKTMIPMFIVFIIREDWPVEERLNAIISRLVEGNIYHRVRRNRLEQTLKKHKFNEKQKDNQGFTVITFKDLAFAFAILGIGLAGATVVFFLEICMRRKFLNMTKTHGWAMVRKLK